MSARKLEWTKISKCENKCKHRKGVIVLNTCEGDNRDGIRRDIFCPVCKTVWGCTAAHRFKLHNTLEILEMNLDDLPGLKRYLPELIKQRDIEEERNSRRLYEQLKKRFEPEK